ncbi:ankyrin [Thozetella sp. PMI_491]|nr:ankyrin [Thozetella sp. PMI_491]
MLVALGADVDAVDNKGRSCLVIAGEEHALIQLLINNGASVDAEALFGAIDGWNARGVDALLSGGADPDMRRLPTGPDAVLPGQIPYNAGIDRDQIYPLYYAAKVKPDMDARHYTTQGRTVFNKAVLQALLKRGADPYAVFTGRENYPYRRRRGRRTKDTQILKSTSESLERIVIHEIISSNGIVQPFLELPSLDLELRDYLGRTLLLAACSNRYGVAGRISPAGTLYNGFTGSEGMDELSFVEILISRGADVNARDNAGQNMLHYVALQESSNKVLCRVVTGVARSAPHLLLQCDEDGYTPLQLALSQNNIHAAELFIDAGSDLATPDPEGNTGLHYLASQLFSSSVQKIWYRFIAAGVDVNTLNKMGESALWVFSKSRPQMGRRYGNEGSQNLEAMRLLEEAGVDFTVRGKTGQTLLHAAARTPMAHCRGELTERFKWLMARGVDPAVEDDEGNSAIDVAVQSRNKEILELFKPKKQG